MIFIFLVTYIIFPILSTPLAIVGSCIDNKRSKYYIFAIIFNLALIGYYFEPLIADYLYRHFEYIDMYKSMNLKDTLVLYSTDPLIIKNIWFYLISLTNVNSLLPFSAIIITYSMITNIVYDFGKKEKISNGLIVSMIFIILTLWQLIWVMSGVRFSVSIALFFYALYREYILKKKNWLTYLFYIAGCFIHYSTFVLLLFKVLLIFKNRINILTVSTMLFWGYFVEIMISILKVVKISYIQEIAFKAQVYLSYRNESLYMITTNYIKLVYCIVLILAWISLRKTEKTTFYKYKDIYDYLLLISMFCIGGFNIFIILDRFGFFILAGLPLILMPLFKYSLGKFGKQLYILFYTPLIVTGLYLQYIPMRATSFSITFSELFTKNIIDLIIK